MTFVSNFSNSLKNAGVDYKVVENVVDVKDKNKSLNVSKFQGKTFSVARNVFADLPKTEMEVDTFVNEWLSNNLQLDSFDLRTSKNYASNNVLDLLKWKSWIVLSNKQLIDAKNDLEGYVFLTFSKENLYFTVFNNEDLKQFVQHKKIGDNDRHHFHLGELKKWILF